MDVFSDIFYIFVSLRFPNSYTIFQVEISMYAAAKNNGNLLYFLREIPKKSDDLKLTFVVPYKKFHSCKK